jgi:STE24 endopeptidase
VYSTFVLEEKHGFNKTTPGLFVIDLIKGWALAFVLGSPFLAVFLYIFKWAGDRFVPWLMAFMYVFSTWCRLAYLIYYRISFQLIMVIIYPTVIQPMFNKLSPLSSGDLRNRIEALATKLKFPLKHLYEIDGSKRSSHSNAYFFGLPWVRPYFSLTSSVLTDLPEQTHRHLRYADPAE